MEAPANSSTSANVVLPPQGNKIEISGNGRVHIGDVISFGGHISL